MEDTIVTPQPPKSNVKIFLLTILCALLVGALVSTYVTIRVLEKQNLPIEVPVQSDVIATSTTPVKVETPTYIAESGLEKHGSVIREYPFVFKGTTGSIQQLCWEHVVVQHIFQPNVCLGETSVALVWNGARTRITSHMSPTLSDVWTLEGVGFTEGHFIAATSSDTENIRLFIYETPEDCLAVDGMCWSTPQATHSITFPYVGSTSVQTITNMTHGPDSYSWNQDGTKAVKALGCPEGCPNEVLVGVIPGASTKEVVLLTETDAPHRLYDGGKVEWLDIDTVRITLGDGTVIERTF